MKIVEVIIPAAGLGTRFLPLTKSIPKEMLPIGNKPALQFIIEEALQSHVNNFFLITSQGKESIKHYLHANHDDLNTLLSVNNKESLLSDLDNILQQSNFTYIDQKEQQGLGHAILMAEEYIQQPYFTVMLPDDIVFSKEPALKQLIDVAQKQKATVIAVQEVPEELVSSYGVIKIENELSENLFCLSGLVEKPNISDAPSNLAIIGRYVLPSKIFDSLKKVKLNKGEIQLTDAIQDMMENGEKVFAYKVNGVRYDTGTPLGWIKTIIGYALQHPEYASHVRELLDKLQNS